MTVPENNAVPTSGEPELPLQIQIDRLRYEVAKRAMTGAELRRLPTPPIGLDRDLWQVIPGQPDFKVGLDELAHFRNGLRFFTAPALINPGRGLR